MAKGKIKKDTGSEIAIVNEFLTPQELAKYLGFHRRTIYEKLAYNQIPGVKIFGCWRFRKSVIDNWIHDKAKIKKKRKKKD